METGENFRQHFSVADQNHVDRLSLTHRGKPTYQILREERFHHTDDLMWYSAQLYSKLDSLNIPISNVNGPCLNEHRHFIHDLKTHHSVSTPTSF